LTPEQRLSIVFSQISGTVVAESMYRREGAPERLDHAAEFLEISRSFRVGGQDSRSLPMNGRIQVEIHYRIDADAPDGCYNLIDFLPAGLRYVSLDDEPPVTLSERSHWLLREDGNQLVFGVYKRQEAVEGVLRYNVRVAMPGSFLAESAALVHSALPGMHAATAESRIFIN
jgi:hypothetical protein